LKIVSLVVLGVFGDLKMVYHALGECAGVYDTFEHWEAVRDGKEYIQVPVRQLLSPGAARYFAMKARFEETNGTVFSVDNAGVEDLLPAANQ